MQEIEKLITIPRNLKHRCILMVLYSAGLRIGEVIQLRIEDIHSDEGYLFVKGAKGKKDRKTVLSNQLVLQLRKYYVQFNRHIGILKERKVANKVVVVFRKYFVKQQRKAV